MDDVRRAVTPDVKAAGDPVYLAGVTRDERGASAYHRLAAAEAGTPERFGGEVPRVDPVAARALYETMARAHDRGLLRSSRTPAMGGLAVALAMTALGGDLGLDIDLSAVPAEGGLDDDALLFSESNSRFVLTCAPGRTEELEDCFEGRPCARLGAVTEERRLRVRGASGRLVIDAALDDLRKAFKRTLGRL